MFKLFAFVDPGTPSGQRLRTSMADTSSAGTAASSSGTTRQESDTREQVESRWTQALGRVSEAHRVLGSAAQSAMSSAAPVLAAAGVGEGTDPDPTPGSRRGGGSTRGADSSTGSTGPTGSNGQEQGSPPSDPPTAEPPTPPDVIPPPPSPPTDQGPGPGGSGAPGGSGGSGGTPPAPPAGGGPAGAAGGSEAAAGGGAMSDTLHSGWRRERFGPFAGLSGLQAGAVLLAWLPALTAVGRSRWDTAIPLAVLALLLTGLIVVPIRRRPAIRWLTDTACF